MEGAIEVTSDVELLREIMEPDSDFKGLAKERHAELLGLVSIKRLGGGAKRVLTKTLA